MTSGRGDAIARGYADAAQPVRMASPTSLGLACRRFTTGACLEDTGAKNASNAASGVSVPPPTRNCSEALAALSHPAPSARSDKEHRAETEDGGRDGTDNDDDDDGEEEEDDRDDNDDDDEDENDEEEEDGPVAAGPVAACTRAELGTSFVTSPSSMGIKRRRRRCSATPRASPPPPPRCKRPAS